MKRINLTTTGIMRLVPLPVVVFFGGLYENKMYNL